MKNNRLKKVRKGKRLAGIVRNIAVFICIFSIAIFIYSYISSGPISLLFPVRNIVFVGNKHLTDDELESLAGVQINKGMLMISNKSLSERLVKSPWIKSVIIRKGFPDTLIIMIEESIPFALLDMNGHLFLMDENGKFLEELRDDSIPFLPIITGDPFAEKDGFSEAMKLAKFMHDSGFVSERDHIVISTQKPHELTATIDGTVVKIGSGGYEEKLERFLQLEKDIKNMRVPVDYIDLRFHNKAIVRPFNDKVRQ
jgi:cell division protein FtsQ